MLLDPQWDYAELLNKKTRKKLQALYDHSDLWILDTPQFELQHTLDQPDPLLLCFLEEQIVKVRKERKKPGRRRRTRAFLNVSELRTLWDG
jgi:hypothetical protein